MSKLDDMAKTFRNAGKYPGNVTSGDDLLELFLGGGLSNTSATDDMATVLLSIFKTADDIQLIRALAKEMVDGDAIFRQGVLNGSINPIVAFGQKQGDEILDYAYRAYGRTNPFSPGGVYNPNTSLGNWNSNIIPGLGQLPQIPQDYVIKKLRASFAGNSKAIKYLEKAKDDINSFIPTNQRDAEEIVRKNEALIDAYLAKKGLGGEFKEMFKKTLVNNWATKGAVVFFILLGLSYVFMIIMKLTGFNGLTPLKNGAIGDRPCRTGAQRGTSGHSEFWYPPAAGHGGSAAVECHRSGHALGETDRRENAGGRCSAPLTSGNAGRECSGGRRRCSRQ
jgi:hypothetical protein